MSGKRRESRAENDDLAVVVWHGFSLLLLRLVVQLVQRAYVFDQPVDIRRVA